MIKKESVSKYTFIIIFLVLILIVFLIIKPFITAILTSFILVYIFYPVYKKLNNKIKKKNLSALIVSLLIILIFSIPSVFIIDSFVNEINLGYISFKKTIDKGLFECKEESTLCRISDFIKKKKSDPKFRSYVDKAGTELITKVTQGFSKLIISIPKILLNILIILFLTFYLFKDGKLFFLKLMDLLPIRKKDLRSVIKTFNDVLYATLYGQILVVIIQGTLGGIGFYIFGVSSPVFWGVMMVIFSLLPFVGSSIIWAPAAIYLVLSGLATSNNSLIFHGIGLLLYGMLLISTIDNILRPRIVGNKIGMHPAFVFLGVIGGIMLFGPLGILLGPLFIAILIVFYKIYKKKEFL